jgi:hypothetical protein
MGGSEAEFGEDGRWHKIVRILDFLSTWFERLLLDEAEVERAR